MKPSRGKCEHCGADVQWAINRETGRKAPLDPEPDRVFGNLLVDEWSWTFVKLEPPIVARAIEKRERLYVNHLMLCPALQAKAS